MRRRSERRSWIDNSEDRIRLVMIERNQLRSRNCIGGKFALLKGNQRIIASMDYQSGSLNGFQLRSIVFRHMLLKRLPGLACTHR